MWGIYTNASGTWVYWGAHYATHTVGYGHTLRVSECMFIGSDGSLEVFNQMMDGRLYLFSSAQELEGITRHVEHV